MKNTRLYLPFQYRLKRRTFLLLALCLIEAMAFSQDKKIRTIIVDSSEPGFRTVIAGPEYRRGALHRFFWGNNYRKEWTTAVRVPVINLDSAAGGLTPVKEGGGRQTKNLRLVNRQGKQYVLRSVNKDYRGALPEIARNTFLERLAKDQVSTVHPYAAITIPPMIRAAGIYHTRPVIVFVPYSKRLGEYNETFANQLFLFEERPDEDQSDAPNFGYSKNVIGTEKLLEKTTEENDNLVDQEAFVRARLFDMFLGDWGRHEDQWRWSKFDVGDLNIYKPVPRDRDQTWARFQGFLIRKITGAESLEHLQSFDHKIKNIKKYNFPARYIDRRFTNEMNREVWLQQAGELQKVLTDDLIDSSIRRMPPEIFSISGPEIISKLKSRRNLLMEFADKYYKFISEAVDVVGSEQEELFDIQKIDENQVLVRIFDLNKKGEPKDSAIYSRLFSSDYTDEINIYGLRGNDIYRIHGNDDQRIRIRIIGGYDRDSLVNLSGSSKNITYHDNRDNFTNGRIRTRFSEDTTVHSYNYFAYKYNSGSTILRPWYSNTRGVHIQFGYDYTKQGWRKEPYNWMQQVFGYYSISNRSWGGEYEALFYQLLGKWNLSLQAHYDQKLEQYFFGYGNNTSFDFDKNSYRYYSREYGGSAGLWRPFGKHHTGGITTLFQSVEVLKQDGHTLSQQNPLNKASTYQRKNFSGADVHYNYRNLNDEVVPTKGFVFSAGAGKIFNLTEKGSSFNRLNALAGFYLPLSNAFSLAVRTGAAGVSGDPEFYQLPWLGGGSTLRGFFRQRFHGETVFYNGADLRWIFNTRNIIFNGKIGLIAFLDNGRVWHAEGRSDNWHQGYGGGIMLAPFNKVSVTVYYGFSEETRRFHISLGNLF